MGPGNQAGALRWVPRLLAGIEAGVLGGLAMIAGVAAVAAATGQPVWTAPNLFASLFLGPAALDRTFHSATVSGLALQLFAAGLVGLAFGACAGGSRSRLRVFLLGILAGLIWYYLAQTLLMRKFGVTALLYTAPKTMLFGNLCLGVVLGLYPVFLKAAEGNPRRAATPPEPAAPEEAAGLPQGSAAGTESAGTAGGAACPTESAGPQGEIACPTEAAGPPEEIGRM
jgi:hypothetical protein